MDTNKFEQLNTHQLILFVQQQARIDRKKLSPKRRIKLASDLGQARTALVKRLEQMDRNMVMFFPIGAEVGYREWQVYREGIVHQQLPAHILVQFNDSVPGYFTKVEPRYLELLNIRHKYI